MTIEGTYDYYFTEAQKAGYSLAECDHYATDLILYSFDENIKQIKQKHKQNNESK